MPRDRLYSVDERDGDVVLRFTTPRSAPLVFALLVSLGFVAAFTFAVRMGWNSDVLSGIFGGFLGLGGVLWFAVSQRLTRYEVLIEEDLIRLRREFYRIPVEKGWLLSRREVTDLGVYPRDGHSTRLYGVLCVWVNGKSIELERYFPIDAGIALAQDLRDRGIEFPRTYDQFTEERLLYGSGRYLSF